MKNNSLCLLTKSITEEMLELGINILGLLLKTSNMKKEANPLIETRMVNLSMGGTLMANQSIRCYLPLKK